MPKKTMQSKLRGFFYHHDALKQFIEGILVGFGFCVVPSDTGFRFVRIRTGQGEYSPIYSPWKGDNDFAKLVDTVTAHTTTRPRNLWLLYSLVKQTLGLGGEIWEVGVYKGGGARVMERAQTEADPSVAPLLRLFDTFEGVSGSNPEHDYLRDGPAYDGSEADVRHVLEGDKFSIHKGAVPETFKSLENVSISFLHLDVDLFTPTLATLEFAAPRMKKSGVILVETYGYATHLGVREAVDAFCTSANRHVTVLPTAQAILIF
jgi:O-methyltransferase